MFQLISLFILLSTIMSANKQIILLVSEKFDASKKRKRTLCEKNIPAYGSCTFLHIENNAQRTNKGMCEYS